MMTIGPTNQELIEAETDVLHKSVECHMSLSLFVTVLAIPVLYKDTAL